MWVRPVYPSVHSRIWKSCLMVFLWTRCLFPWPWMVVCFRYWHSISTQVWSKVLSWRKWPVRSRTIYWKSSWYVIPIFTRLSSPWRLSLISSSIPLRRCRSSTLSLSPVIICRRLVRQPISNWLTHWLTVWNISVQVLPQVSILMLLLRVSLSSGPLERITLWKLPKCVQHVCYGRRLWSNSIRRTRNL